MLYVDIDGVKHEIPLAIAKKYGVKAGDKTVMGYEVREDK